MTQLIPIVENHTTTTIDLCKACLDGIPLFSGSRIKLPLTAKGAIHGHSDLGSFIISKYNDNFALQAWGEFVITGHPTHSEYIVKITLKKAHQ